MPIVSGGGGGSASGLPSQWTKGSGGNVVATTDDGTTPFTIEGDPLNLPNLLTAKASHGGATILSVDAQGVYSFSTFKSDLTTTRANLSTSSSGSLHIAAYTSTGDQAAALDLLSSVPAGLFGNTAAQWFAVVPTGCIITGTHAAPADGDLSAGDCALWFDQSNGAAKLMVKGKSADGTVVAAAIALA